MPKNYKSGSREIQLKVTPELAAKIEQAREFLRVRTYQTRTDSRVTRQELTTAALEVFTTAVLNGEFVLYDRAPSMEGGYQIRPPSGLFPEDRRAAASQSGRLYALLNEKGSTTMSVDEMELLERSARFLRTGERVLMRGNLFSSGTSHVQAAGTIEGRSGPGHWKVSFAGTAKDRVIHKFDLALR